MRAAGEKPDPVGHKGMAGSGSDEQHHEGGEVPATRVTAGPAPGSSHKACAERPVDEALAEWWLDQSWEEGAISGVDVPRAAKALATLMRSVRAATVEECAKAVEALPGAWSPSTVAKCAVTIRSMNGEAALSLSEDETKEKT